MGGGGVGGAMGVARWWRKRECSREGVRLRIAVCVRQRWHVVAGVLMARGVLTYRLARSVQRAWAQRRGARGWEGAVLVGRLGGVGGCGGVGRGLGPAKVVAFMWVACVA